MFKLFLSDLDDTLLDHNKKWSPNFEQFRATLAEKNVAFTLATGRSAKAVQPIIDELDLKLPYATSNGANIMLEGQVIQSFSFPIGPLRPLIEVALSMGLTVVYVVNGEEFALEDTEFIRHELKNNFTEQIIRPIKPEDWASMEVDKFLIVDDHPQTALSRLHALVNNLKPEYRYLTYSDWAMDIVAANVSKGRALHWIADYLGITSDQVIAAGDNHNDIDLLKEAGRSIAAFNALDEVKRTAMITAKKKYGDGIIEEVLKILE
ncbi:Cof-type HAD-IIB family hydrolase [Facklamia sp. P12950]|uniref:Cof-type HAD-IIB family hydrolase n=1 Tax=Facklamia sp. P12950 TaxID=3421951 RepID=UPI003D168132